MGCYKVVMPGRFCRFLSSCLFLTLVFPALVSGQGGASLAIGFAGGNNQFRLGEVIPIELSFSASLPDTYDMESRNYDRSGRLDMERFHVTPPGRDPLESYFSEGAFVGGGLGGPRPLNSEPRVMREDLNEWVALDTPGHYSLYVTSTRVSRRTAARSESMELRSNTLDFDVIAADAAWQQQTLASAIAVLGNSSATEQERESAVRILRFLDTPESVHELVKAFDTLPQGRRFDVTAGLFGSRHQALVVRELEEQMSAPGTAITTEYLHALARLKFQIGRPPMPPYPQHDPEQQKVWQEQMHVRSSDLDQVLNELYRKAAALVESKRGSARTETVRTLLIHPARTSADIRPLSLLPDTEIAATFLALTPDQQYELLSTFWARVRVSAMSSALQSLAAAPELKHQMLRDAVLQRLYELDPAEATPFIVAEIKLPHRDSGMFTVKADTLGVLPKATMPEFDELLVSRIENRENRTSPLDAELIGRYASKSMLPRVKAVYERASGKWDCQIEDGLITYFLRTDPDYGVHQLANSASLCMTHGIPAVVRMKRWGEIQPTLVANLTSPDLNRARWAAETLAKFGDAKAERAMWERLRKLHERWASRENEFAGYRPGASREVMEAVGFQYGLVQSIAVAQNWTLTDEQLDELATLALGLEFAGGCHSKHLVRWEDASGYQPVSHRFDLRLD